MSKKQHEGEGLSGPSAHKQRLAHEAEGAAAGAIVGAAVGMAAGPPGAVAGAIIGGVVGAMTGAGLDAQSAADTARERQLDEDIGVSGGDIGAPNLEHPPATRGIYSSASAGTDVASGATPAEGPFSQPE